MIYEFCAENLTDLSKAHQAGAHRIEICDNLAVGGTTPSYGVIKEALKQALPVQVLIRPRGGNFVYNPQEIAAMKTDMTMALQLGVDGLVFGCLTPDNQLDKSLILEFLSLISEGRKKPDLVFHMAFDQIPAEEQKLAINWLANHGFSRILTRGGQAGDTLETRSANYRRLLEIAGSRITILAGGGITLSNRQDLVQKTGLRELHGTQIVFEKGD